MKQKSIKTTLLIFGLAMFISNNSFGQAQNRPEGKTPPSYEQLLEEMDTDEDGKLSITEIEGPLKDAFTQIDTNEDGLLTREEFEAAPKPKRRKPRDNH